MSKSTYNNMFSASGYCQCEACAAICAQEVFGFDFADPTEELTAANICGGTRECCEAQHITGSTTTYAKQREYYTHISSGQYVVYQAVPNTIVEGYVSSISYRAAELICQNITGASSTRDVWVKSGLFSAYDTVWLSDLVCEQNALDLAECGFKSFNTTHVDKYVEVDAVCCSDFNLINTLRCSDSTTSNDNACSAIFENFNDAVLTDTSTNPRDGTIDHQALDPYFQLCSNSSLNYGWGCLHCPTPTFKLDIAPTVQIFNTTMHLDVEQYIQNQTIVYYNDNSVLLFEPEPNCF